MAAAGSARGPYLPPVDAGAASTVVAGPTGGGADTFRWRHLTHPKYRTREVAYRATPSVQPQRAQGFGIGSG